MEFHPQFGISLPDQNWVPAPRYLMRREVLLDFFSSREPGKLLEIGCGAGALLYDLARLGLDCEALEISPVALDLACKVHASSGAKLHSQPNDSWAELFDYVCAFEVLEHTKDDFETIKEWVKWLRPGGTLIISVPAHQWRFSTLDRAAGHFRRYSKARLTSLAAESGLQLEKILSYGFPVADLVEMVKITTLRSKYKVDGNNDDEEKRAQTETSGVQRSLDAKIYPFQKTKLGQIAVRCCLNLQKPFLKTSLGGGYIMIATKQ